MVQVVVSEGTLEGEEVINELGGSFLSFKGVPYAEPPLGNLRFKAPQPPKSWQGVRSAKEFGDMCYNYDFGMGIPPEPAGSEDCLYLNVYTPNLKPNNPLPVMFYIHGGGFMSGSGNDDVYGPDFIVRHGVILVTFNYRLHLLGFLCLDTEDAPGNAGMKDQVAALRWVKKNIAHFGGDPDNITIFGNSAGGASVACHLISPMSKGLFKRAISQSGSTTCDWTFTFEPRQRAIAFAKKRGFQSEDDKELYEFFKTCPYEDFIDCVAPITFTEQIKESLRIDFGIVSEKQFGSNERFFYGDAIDILRNGIHEGVDVITGYCEDEGVLQVIGNFEKFKEQANNFLEIFVPPHIASNCPLRSQFEVARLLRNHYLGNQKVTSENSWKLLKYCGAQSFTFDIRRWLKFVAKKNTNTSYLYKMTVKTERNLYGLTFLKKTKDAVSKMPVTSHADELPYLFSMKVFPQKVEKNTKIFEIVENVTKLWTNFAKYGNPTPDSSLGVKWLPYCLEKEDYLEIGESLVAGTAPDKEEYELWNTIFKKHLPRYVPC